MPDLEGVKTEDATKEEGDDVKITELKSSNAPPVTQPAVTQQNHVPPVFGMPPQQMYGMPPPFMGGMPAPSN